MQSLTKEKRDSLSPQDAIAMLKAGNERFVKNSQLNRDLLQQVGETAGGQNPFAIILSCIDSRASAELIFDQGIGDIFSCRIAGNVLNDDIVGSMEFACKVAGAKLIVVLGHSACGAVKGACDGVELGKLSGLLNKIAPAVESEKDEVADRSSGNSAFVDRVAGINVDLVADQITKESAILKEMVEGGEIAIVGGMYDVASGGVGFF